MINEHGQREGETGSTSEEWGYYTENDKTDSSVELHREKYVNVDIDIDLQLAIDVIKASLFSDLSEVSKTVFDDHTITNFDELHIAVGKTMFNEVMLDVMTEAIAKSESNDNKLKVTMCSCDVRAGEECSKCNAFGGDSGCCNDPGDCDRCVK